jgi:hypothetical protein
MTSLVKLHNPFYQMRTRAKSDKTRPFWRSLAKAFTLGYNFATSGA